MKKKVVSLLAAAVLAVQGMAMPILANAEASATYITNSDFKDCAVGGAKGDGYYGLNIIMDGSPWLSKGSASEHYETYMHDDERDVNYCNFYSNSDKTPGDGAGSMYVYQRDTTQNFQQNYGYCQFDLRWNSGVVKLMIGSFTDATSNTDYLANSITIGQGGNITAMDGSKSVNVASIKEGEWYTVKIMIDNALQECSISVADMSGKIIGLADEISYQDNRATCVRTWCFGYVRGSAYNYDLTNVTIDKSTETKNPYSVK